MKKLNQNISTSKRRSRPIIQRLSDYYERRLESFATAVDNARLYYAIDGIHDLRVETKKLRAFYRLLEFLAPELNFDTERSAIKKLYRSAGELRDIDINQAIAYEFLKKNDIGEYYNNLKEIELSERERFQEVAKLFRVPGSEKTKKRILSALNGIPQAQIINKFDKKLKKSASRLNEQISVKQLSAEDLHSIRKSCKSFRYMLDMRGLEPRAGVEIIRSLKTTYDSLGKWRDMVITGESLEIFLRGGKSIKIRDRAAYRKFKVLIKASKDGHLKSFINHSKKLRGDLKKTILSLKIEGDAGIKMNSGEKSPTFKTGV